MPARILVVDDEPSVLTLCKKMLERRGGHAVETALSTGEALRLLDTAPHPDLVLMDIVFPDRDEPDGIRAVSAMRARGYEGVVCMMSGSTSSEKLLRAAVAGADSYLTKGAGMHLVEEVELLLKKAAQMREGATPNFHPEIDGVYLRSLGLDQHQVELLAEYVSRGCPRTKELANAMGMEQSALSMRLYRIRNRLGFDNMNQVVRMMSALAAFPAMRGRGR